MLTSIASLALMLLLARLPFGGALFGSGGPNAYMTLLSYSSDPLPLITTHEIRRERPRRPVESIVRREVLPESDLLVDELEELELVRPGIDARVQHRLPAVAASLTLHDLTSTSEFMQTAITAPVVDSPPRLRIGSMLIDYPLSALRKAIEGLVIVRFTVETDGRAYGIDIVSGLEPACDAAVVDALRDARFFPGQFRGRNVPALSQLAVRFRIDERGGYY